MLNELIRPIHTVRVRLIVCKGKHVALRMKHVIVEIVCKQNRLWYRYIVTGTLKDDDLCRAIYLFRPGRIVK